MKYIKSTLIFICILTISATATSSFVLAKEKNDLKPPFSLPDLPVEIFTTSSTSTPPTHATSTSTHAPTATSTPTTTTSTTTPVTTSTSTGSTSTPILSNKSKTPPSPGAPRTSSQFSEWSMDSNWTAAIGEFFGDNTANAASYYEPRGLNARTTQSLKLVAFVFGIGGILLLGIKALTYHSL